MKKIGNDEHLRKAFAYFDQNNSGYIEIEELKNALADDLGPNHEEVINAIIHDVDTDKVSLLLILNYICIPSHLLSFSYHVLLKNIKKTRKCKKIHVNP